MDQFVSAKQELSAVVEERKATPMNEATTRLRLIDRLLMNCLDWRPAEITTEEYQAGEYVDYALGTPATEAILEAKKEGHHFAVPVGVVGRREVDIRSLL